jgi:hypothetical protein
MRTTWIALAGVGAMALIGLSACDNGPSAVRTRDRDVSQASYSSGGSGGGYSDRASSRNGDSSRDGGRDGGGDSHSTWWASSRKRSSADGASAQFQKAGAEFGAKDVNDYADKAHAFVTHPPRGTLTLERKNGDRLLYDPKANVFAVANRDGAPRTMFKPRDGMAYWEQQKAREADREAGRRSSRSGDSKRDDQAG